MKSFIIALVMFATAGYACEMRTENFISIPTSDQCENPFSSWGVEDDTYNKGMLVCSMCGIVITYYTLGAPASVIAYSICNMCASKAYNDLYDSKYKK